VIAKQTLIQWRQSAIATLNFAAKAGNNLHRIADDTGTLTVEAFRQDLDYRNRPIEIFGGPYPGTIGFGNLYPEGYQDPIRKAIRAG